MFKFDLCNVEIHSHYKSYFMSKDKGQKNQKKSPADKTSGKIKVGSSYKNEGKSEMDNGVSEAFHPKPVVKSGKNT